MRPLLAIALTSLVACHGYTYYARETRPDSSGVPREVLAYWHVTDRVFWFDESSEGIVLKLACSTFTMDFEEQPQGIVLRADQGWTNARDLGGVSSCGRVLDVRRVQDLHTGDRLRIELWCTPALTDEFTVVGPYLSPGTYEFEHVERTRGTVDVGPCVVPRS